MQIEPDLQQIKTLLGTNTKTLIATPPQVELETVHAAYVLKKVIGQNHTTHTTDLLLDPRAASFAQPELRLGQDYIPQVPPRPLLIQVPLQGARLKKIQYNTEDGFLNLTLQPDVGQFPPDAVTLKNKPLPYSLLVTLGVINLEQLDRFYQDYSDEIRQLNLVNLDYHNNNSLFGKINLIYEEASSATEVVVRVVKDLGYTLDHQTAQRLMTGLANKTAGFTQKLTPEIFRTAASLNALGAQPTPVREEALPAKGPDLENDQMR